MSLLSVAYFNISPYANLNPQHLASRLQEGFQTALLDLLHCTVNTVMCEFADFNMLMWSPWLPEPSVSGPYGQKGSFPFRASMMLSLLCFSHLMFHVSWPYSLHSCPSYLTFDNHLILELVLGLFILIPCALNPLFCLVGSYMSDSNVFFIDGWHRQPHASSGTNRENMAQLLLSIYILVTATSRMYLRTWNHIKHENALFIFVSIQNYTSQYIVVGTYK